MSWYRCSGCGPSQQCDVCGASQCSQDLRNDCLGCMRAKFAAKGPVPWNMQWPPNSTRPWKHNRKWLTRNERHMKLFRRMYSQSICTMDDIIV